MIGVRLASPLVIAISVAGCGGDDQAKQDAEQATKKWATTQYESVNLPPSCEESGDSYRCTVEVGGRKTTVTVRGGRVIESP
jgi:hypothetical protein